MKRLVLHFLCVPIFMSAQVQEHSHDISNQVIFSTPGVSIQSSKFVSVEFENSECLTDQARFQMEVEIAQNKAIILQNNPDAFSNLGGGSVMFVDPYQPKSGLDEYGYHTLQNQVDQNLTPNNQLLDYNCGDRTYDWATGNHQGTDYILWPYPWKRMDENVMEVVAAADGIIVNKRDGHFDQNCLNNGNPNWNGFVIEHADGSQTIYMHFKKNTLNEKEIGETVVAGEYLGVAGSSGSSTIPHLHFEVRDSENNVIDPYTGDCNSMNDNSWWQVQEAYAVPRINTISTHSVATQDVDCPVVENTYEKINFIPGDMLYLKLFFRDINHGDTTHIEFKNPNGDIMYSWDWVNDWGDFFPTSYAYWEFATDNTWIDGVYTITATFGGNSYETIFGINTELGLDDRENSILSVYPNPAKNTINVAFDKPIDSVNVLGMDGRVFSQQIVTSKQAQINISNLPKGVYILRIKSGNTVEHKKFIKE